VEETRHGSGSPMQVPLDVASAGRTLSARHQKGHPMHGIHLGVKEPIVANSCILAITITEDDVIVVVMHPRGLT
jgi:hypothetical protein